MVWSSLAHDERWHSLETLERRWDSRRQCEAVVPVIHLDGSSRQRKSGPTGPSSMTPQASGFVHDLQELLNIARKAEQKTLRLQKFKAKASEQWQMYQQSLKDAWLKEHARFLRDAERRDRELQEAAHDQQRAFQAVRQAWMQSGGAANTAMESSLDDQWEKMKQGWEREDGVQLQSILQRAVAPPLPAEAPNPMKQLRPEFVQCLSSFGAGSPWEVPAATTTMNAAPGLSGQTGPGQFGHPACFGVPPPGAAAEGADPTHTAHAGTRTGEAPPRLDIKKATKVTVATDPLLGPGLADKLDQKREQALGWLRSLCFASIPLQVWAAPKPWGEAVEIILTATRRFPDPLPPAESSSAEHPFGENDGSPPEELDADIGRAEASNVPFWARPGFTGPPVMNHPDLPVPPLDETPEVEDPDEFAQCYCFVMAPHFHAEILSVAVRFPTTVDSFCNQVRSALTALKLRYLPQVVPTFPQIDNGYASLVVTAPWLAAAGKQIVVIDLRPLGGAVYSVIMWERVHYFDCLQALGDSWPFTIDEHNWHTPEVSEDEGSETSSDEGLIRWVTILVLKPLYQPEVITVVVQFPTSVEDFNEIVQGGRLRKNQLAFPHLKDVQPQPSAQTPVLIAMPRWYGLSMLVCFDTTRIDNRIFTVEVPDRVDKQQLLMYADLPPNAEVRIFVGRDEQPLAENARIQVYPAITITFWPPEGPPPDRQPAAVLFQQGRTWRDVSEFEILAPDARYCLILRYGFRLFWADRSTPWTYRRRKSGKASQSAGAPVWLESGRDVSPAQGHRAEAEVQIGFRPFTAVFLILVPAYAQEISILQLGAPATVAEVKAALQNGRSAQSFRRFPHLIEAFPQPDTTFGVLVAVPDWDCMAAFVVVDSRQAGGRLFAAAVPARADRTLLLSVCGFDPNGQFVVYIQDTPWHLVDGPQVRVSHGDLVLVTIPDHPVIVSASLSDMLLSAQGWASIAQVPIQLFGSAWFVADAPHFGFRLPMNIEQQYQRELASYLAVEQEEVVVSPALPSIVDHSTAGRTSGSVFHVRVADNQRSTGMVSCILDLRPIVGSLESVVLPEGLFDGIAFLEGFLPGVPFGFGVGVFGGHPSFGNGPRHVQNGTVLTVEYLTDDQYTLLRQSEIFLVVLGCCLTPYPVTCCAEITSVAVYTDGSFDGHIRGHQGNPYNELADTIAGTRSLEDSAFPTAFGHLCQWAIHGKLQWLWLSVAALLCPECWPTVGVNGFTDPFGNSTLSLNDIGPSDLFGPQLGQSANASDAATSLQLVPLLITVNVQSLCEDDSSRLPNRVPFAREQLEAFGCAVAGLQETRAKSTTTVTSASHIRFLSGCDSKGCLGVELWFSKTVPFGWVGRTPLLFAVSDFRVLHWTPRMLFVRYVKGALRILFVTCHAPTATSAERTTWWKGFVDLLLQTANGDKVVVLGDLTSRLCDPVANRVGSLVWEQEHAPPEPFFRMLRELDLWIPATFTGCHQGACHTWVAPGGTAVSRIDFILVPSGWSVPIGGSRVLYEVDFGQAGLDHFAAQLSIDTTCIARLAFSVTQQGFDCHRALQPEASVDVQEIVSSVPQVSWDVDAHRHYHVVASHLISELSRRFPVQKGQRRRTFFSDATWALRQQRVWLRRQAHLASAFLSHWEIQGAFIAWLSGNTVKAELISSFGKVLRSLRQDRSQQLSEIASQEACHLGARKILAVARLPPAGVLLHVETAQQTALLVELWEAEVQHYHGLLFRYFLSKGAIVSELVEDPLAPVEVCAVCHQRFADLRCWSHHAFKRHGRVREARQVAQGTQCQVCLRHFASTFRLSNHLEHSRACLAALVQHGRFVEAMPGRGSKGFCDGRDSLLPAVTASGPSLQWSGEGFVPEADRPDPCILEGLTEIFCRHTEFSDFHAVISAARAVFSQACLQQSRLRATAKRWKAMLQEELGTDEDVSVQWAAWQGKLADWLCGVDFASWLVPEAAEPARPAQTFRDSTVLLPWLVFDSLLLPDCGDVSDLGLRVVAPDRRSLGGRLHREVPFFSHEQCILSPHLLDFSSWISEHPFCVTGLCLSHLVSSLQAPPLIKHFKALAPRLGRLRLMADLVRGVLHLWAQGRPAFLLTTAVACPGLSAVRRAAPFTERIGEAEVLSNFQGRASLVSRFTF
ncbi:unnamed protein product [Symbiodinium sp. KB8]|nr:unnamed protein product [Symbiodinium sp. KB8]